MAKRITLFNHKGGVSKTTTTFNLGWMLAEKGYKVILVDADPQCNLTGMVLGFGTHTKLDEFYGKDPERNLKGGLAPAFESRPTPLKPVECIPVEGRNDLYLLPGHIGISEYDVTLGIAQELSGTIQTLQNLPGSISHLLSLTAAHHDASFILVDLNPSLSPTNQNLFSTSDAFILPATPDYFCVLAIQALSKVLPNWQKWADRASTMDVLREAVYPFPRVFPRFLGTVIQNYRPRAGVPTKAFQEWINKINGSVVRELYPALRDAKLTYPDDDYVALGIENYCLASMSDFNSLIAHSQKHQTPVFALSEGQLSQGGSVLRKTMEARDTFRERFSELADRVTRLVDNADSD